MGVLADVLNNVLLLLAIGFLMAMSDTPRRTR